MAIDLVIPSVGESITEVEVGEWLKKQGDYVEADEPIVEIESDKATVEIFAPSAGTISEVLMDTGTTAKVGDIVGKLEEGEQKGDGKDKSEQTKAEKPAAESQPAAQEAEEPQPPAEPEPDDSAAATVMPAAQRLMDERGLDAAKIKGTGKGGRILKEDVQNYLDRQKAEPEPKAEPKTAPGQSKLAQPPSGSREEEVVRLSPMRRTIARTLVQAQQDMALLTTFNEIDMGAVVELRNQYKEAYQKKYDIKLGFMSFFVKACVEALKAYPAVNAQFRENEAIYHNYYDIGIAVGGGRGLVVPILRNAERMSFAEIELAIADFGRRAQENKIGLDELEGGTFTITNGGIYGSLMSTPIINPPQSGILGMHAIQDRPMVRNKEIVIRPMMYVALTYDHRIVDGREAVSFLVKVKECVETPSRILLEI